MSNVNFQHAHDHAVVSLNGPLDWDAAFALVDAIDTMVETYFYTTIELVVSSPGGDIQALHYCLARLDQLAKDEVRLRTRVLSFAAGAGAVLVDRVGAAPVGETIRTGAEGLTVPEWRTLYPPDGTVPRDALTRHMLVLGETGSGKTASCTSCSCSSMASSIAPRRSTVRSPTASWNGSTERCSTNTSESKAGALGSRPSTKCRSHWTSSSSPTIASDCTRGGG